MKRDRLHKSRQAAATARRTRLAVAWYGGGTRLVEAATEVEDWFKGECELVPVWWVLDTETTGTHLVAYLFTTDPGLCTKAVVAAYCDQWNIQKPSSHHKRLLGPSVRSRTQSAQKGEGKLRVLAHNIPLLDASSTLLSTEQDRH